jgi:hypothetical protein
MERFEAEQTELIEKVWWRRGSVGNGFVGLLQADEDGIRLCGRDPESGVDIAFSIPSTQVESVHVAPTDGHLNGDLYVALELEQAQPIFVRQVGGSSLHVQLLTRKLKGLLRQPRLLAQGG